MSGPVIGIWFFQLQNRQITTLLHSMNNNQLFHFFSFCARFPSRWTVYAVPSSTQHFRNYRHRCYTGSMESSPRCQGEKVRDAIIRWHVRVTLWRRCTCALLCCRCHSASTLSESTSASLLARFLLFYLTKPPLSQYY